MTERRKIGMIAFDGLNLLDLAGPAQVFTTATEQLALLLDSKERAYEIVILSTAGNPVSSSGGILLETDSLSDHDIGSFDTLLVVGGHGASQAAQDRELVQWIASADRKVRRIGSICTGTFVLAASGLLSGKRVTTHWAYCQELVRLHPELHIEPDAIFLQSGAIWTSAGVSAGTDMALALVEEDWGTDAALLVARRLVLFLKRPGGQAQFSVPLRVQSLNRGRIAEIVAWAIDNPTMDLRCHSLADRAAMSERSFYRKFLQEVGTTPADFVEQLRLEHARRLLEETGDDIAVVAGRSGFVTAERMRRAFQRHLAVSPHEYRSRFRSAGAVSVGASTRISLAARRGDFR